MKTLFILIIEDLKYAQLSKKKEQGVNRNCLKLINEGIGIVHHLDVWYECVTYQSYVTLCNPMVCPWDCLGKNTGMSCHSFLQGICPTQGSNQDLLHCRQILYCLSHQGSPHVYEGNNQRK